MESCSDSDSNDDGHEIGRHGHGDEDIVINTEHASKEVDAEGDGEAEAVAGVDEGMNSCLGRIAEIYISHSFHCLILNHK